jgi:hypothetical protein
MAWNPFRAIGDAIGRVFGRGESTPVPQSEAPQRQPEAQERGWIDRIVDRVTGADRRQEEADRGRQVEERERELAERLRQIEERERQVEDRQRQVEERERASAPPPIAPPPAAPERDLPKFGGDTDYRARDERAFGTDSGIEQGLQEAVDDFIADRGGLDGLSVDAREWLDYPTVSQPFGEYWSSGGFTADQVLGGMTSITNIQITENEDGGIDVEFDYEAEVDGYEVRGHAS